MTVNLNEMKLYIEKVATGLLGDVNEDGTVGIADVTTLIDYLLGTEVTPFNEDNADVAADGTITIADVTALIDLILAQ